MKHFRQRLDFLFRYAWADLLDGKHLLTSLAVVINVAVLCGVGLAGFALCRGYERVQHHRIRQAPQRAASGSATPMADLPWTPACAAGSWTDWQPRGSTPPAFPTTRSISTGSFCPTSRRPGPRRCAAGPWRRMIPS